MSVAALLSLKPCTFHVSQPFATKQLKHFEEKSWFQLSFQPFKRFHKFKCAVQRGLVAPMMSNCCTWLNPAVRAKSVSCCADGFFFFLSVFGTENQIAICSFFKKL